EHDFFLLRAAAESARTTLNAHLNDSDHLDPEDTLSYEQHFEQIGRLHAEALEIARGAQEDLNMVKAELMKLVDGLGDPDVEEVGYVTLWDGARLGKEIEEPEQVKESPDKPVARKPAEEQDRSRSPQIDIEW